MAITSLNKKISKFFDQYNFEQINSNLVKTYFQDLEEHNNYGNILHGIVNYKYDEEKVLKTISILLELGINVNFQAKDTGYSFLHVALYGYTDLEKEKDDSYSTEFILKLIEMAKSYHFNVNLVDNDSDTIIHTAIASETYTGKIVPLIKALGSDFNVKAKDSQGNNIYQAFLFYKKIAKNSSNSEWLKKLTEEEQEIVSVLNIDKNLTEEEQEIVSVLNIDEKTKKQEKEKNDNEKIPNLNNTEIQKLLLKLNQYLDSLTINNFLKPNVVSDIREVNQEFRTLLEKCSDEERNQYTKEEVLIAYNRKLSNIITDYLNKAHESFPSLAPEKLITSFEKAYHLISTLGHTENQYNKVLKDKKINYENYILEIESQLKQQDTLSQITELEQILNPIIALGNGRIDFGNGPKIIHKKVEIIKQPFLELIEKINQVEKEIELLQNWEIEQTYFQYDFSTKKELVDFNLKTKEQLTEYYQKQTTILNNFKKRILNDWKDLIQKLQLGYLITNNLISKEQIEEWIEYKEDSYPKQKGKRKE